MKFMYIDLYPSCTSLLSTHITPVLSWLNSSTDGAFHLHRRGHASNLRSDLELSGISRYFLISAKISEHHSRFIYRAIIVRLVCKSFYRHTKTELKQENCIKVD